MAGNSDKRRHRGVAGHLVSVSKPLRVFSLPKGSAHHMAISMLSLVILDPWAGNRMLTDLPVA
jgi:hypothetical protein